MLHSSTCDDSEPDVVTTRMCSTDATGIATRAGFHSPVLDPAVASQLLTYYVLVVMSCYVLLDSTLASATAQHRKICVAH